jgi:hypothetical protein
MFATVCTMVINRCVVEHRWMPIRNADSYPVPLLKLHGRYANDAFESFLHLLVKLELAELCVGSQISL